MTAGVTIRVANTVAFGIVKIISNQVSKLDACFDSPCSPSVTSDLKTKFRYFALNSFDCKFG